HHGVGFVRLDLPLQHRRGAEFARHRQLDAADAGTGAKTAAGGRERCQKQRRRDRRAAATAHLYGPAGQVMPMQTSCAGEGMSLPWVATRAAEALSVTVALPLASVGPLAPVTVAPEAGLRLPF